MKTMNNTKIIGIDHGYGNMKTANHYFPSGILSFDAEPLFTGDMLTYNGKYYLIGEGHKEFIAEKVNDEDYYILTLAAIAKELKAENITEADVYKRQAVPHSIPKKEFLTCFLLFRSRYLQPQTQPDPPK